MFPLRQEQEYRLVAPRAGSYPFDAHDQLLADHCGNQVLLGRIHVIRQPKDPDPLEKGENDLTDGLIGPLFPHKAIEVFFKSIDIQVDHKADQLVDDLLLLYIVAGKGQYPALQLLFAHLVQMGYFIPIFIQQGNIQDSLQLLVAIIADIRVSTAGFEEAVSLFPYPYGMGLYP